MTSRGERLLFAALAVWALAPIAFMVAHAIAAHERLTGADGTIAADQLQYLAWVRDAGVHELAANLFDLAPSGHVFVHPLFTVSGGLWRLGVSPALAYLLWKPVAIVVLFAGAAAWARRMFPAAPAARLAALAVSLFLYTPLAWIALWGKVGSQAARGNLTQLAGEMFPAGDLWGYLPIAIAVGLMPVALLATERALRRGRVGEAAKPLALAAVAAALVSWLHPWQGLTLLLMLAGLGVWDRGRGARLLAVPAVGTVLPLAYYALLSRYDSAWHLASHNEVVPHLPLGRMLLGLAPLVLVACAGLRRPGGDPMERVLLLWFPASLAVYLATSSFPSHALEGLSLPFAVLAVRAWMRVQPALPSLAAAAAIALLTVPGAAWTARAFRNAVRTPGLGYYLTSSEGRALDWVATNGPRGGVISSTLFAVAIPSQTDRSVWVGHRFWSRDFVQRALAADALLDGRLSAPAARALVSRSGARLVVADCRHRTNLAPALGPMIASVRRFGCATVYVMARGR